MKIKYWHSREQQIIHCLKWNSYELQEQIVNKNLFPPFLFLSLGSLITDEEKWKRLSGFWRLKYSHVSVQNNVYSWYVVTFAEFS
jgi:hypothetical protein